MKEEMAEPKVSVIVPNYNYSKYLRKRIDSILKQTYQDYEIILLDDASTDDSLQVFEEYRNEPGVSLILKNEKNTGSPFRQWMKGILHARGKWIWIAEADDFADDRFLETVVGYAEKYDNVSVCYSGSLLVGPDDKELSGQDINKWDNSMKKDAACFDGIEYIKNNLYWSNYIVNASAVIFRREFALKLEHSAFIDMRYSGDWQFWFEMSLSGNVVEVYKELNYFRKHPQKTTFKGNKEGTSILEDMRVVTNIEKSVAGLSWYKKRIRHGIVLRKLYKLDLPSGLEQNISETLLTEYNTHKSDYILYYINKYLSHVFPFLPTKKRERMK